MFQQVKYSGNTPEFWEDNWSLGSINEAISFYDINPDKVIFDRFLPQGGMILEGGCGLGQYIPVWTNDKRKVVGLDFTINPLKNFKQSYPEYSNYVVNGDVSKLPFPDNMFDAYYSGGVVEHFEDGPYVALREAHRVLKPRGYLIISVPFYNLVRYVNNHFLGKIEKSKRYVWLDKPASKVKYDEYIFFQYAYKKHEFRSILEQAGFRVLFSKKIGFLWGLRELNTIDSFLKRFESSNTSNKVVGYSKSNGLIMKKESKNNSDTLKLFIKGIIIKENIGLCPPIAILQALFANMIYFICVPKK